ncbi:HEAT repeat domain-containing protein [Streptomyces sp. NPDC058746]|uniref:HEAT repeat domain-containing protein n=1 Tax=Streptomyces sp. NPDC058746 TaxID=3346622 RepID=UPI0036896828
MTTPPDEPFQDAMRRADADRQDGRLDARRCPPAALGRLVRHPDPRVRHRGLLLLAERVTAGRTGDASDLAELAGLLPVSLEGPPETDLVLARLHERLGPYRPGLPRPSWRTAGLPARVRIAWLRAELLTDPAVVRTEPPGELLYQAVREAAVADAHRPERLVDELAAVGDPVLQAAALRLAREGLYAGLLAPAPVREHLVDLLGADSTDVVVAALGELAEPWAASSPLPSARLAPFLAADAVRARPGAADAALEAAARHGHGGLLRQVVGDPELPPGLRRRGLELLGDLAGRDDIGALTTVAAQDPLLLAGPALTCLRGLHRRGHFPEDLHVPSVIGLALADHTIAPHEVATILFTCRQETLRVLVDAPAGDPSWPRRLALLVALAAQGAGELPIGDAITRVLPSAPAPGPFLDAIRALRHTDAEDAVIALLPPAPAAALDALEAIGGHRTTTALREGLGLAAAQAPGEIAPHLRAVRHRALEVLWHLTEDPAERHSLLVRLDPTDLPPRIAADLGGPDERELAFLGSHLDPDEPEAALCRLATHGSAGTLPVIADLLLRIVADRAANREPGAAAAPGPHAGEPAVPQEVLDSVRGLGRRLHARGRVRPACLLDAATEGEAGNALLASMALDLLDRPGLSSGELTVLLELLLRAPYAGTRARVHRLLRHRDRHVRKHVIALLARDAAGDDAQALSASLIALTAAPDIQTVRQALLALGHARARWAAGAVAACLGHPNMNVKKTAAAVLVRTGTPEAVPALLHWLGRHDNPGLRDGLTEALRAVLGDAYPATLLAAAEHSEDDRARELLLAGLDGTLPARSVLALDAQAARVAPSLLTLVATRRVGLASGTVEDLATAMAGHGITPAAAPDGGARPDIAALTTEGWDPSVARRIAEREDLPPFIGRMELRPMLADWLRLAADSEPAVRDRVLRLTLRFCPAPWTTDELTAFARSTGTLLAALAEAPAEVRQGIVAVLEAVAPTLPAIRKPAVAEAVRALPLAPAGAGALPTAPAGSPSTLPLLRSLDAVLVRADLDRALASARLGADPRQAETAVLRDAFAVPQPAAAAGADGTESWRAALAAAVRTPSALEAFRLRHDGIPDSRDRLTALIDVYASAGDAVRPALIDWLTDIQPLDAPPWTITETAHAPTPQPRTVRTADLDQPRSTAQRERLLAMLHASTPHHRHTAALALLEWPEPEARLPVLRAFLRGHVDVPADVLIGVLADLPVGGPELQAELRAPDTLHDRAALVASRLAPRELEPLVPLLLQWWEHAPPAAGSAAARALRNAPADVLAEHLEDRLADGAWGFLELLHGRPLLRTPALTRTALRLRAEGRDDLADGLLLVDGPLRHPDAAQQDATALASLRDRTPEATPQPLTRRDLLDLARTGDPVRIRQALTRLTEQHGGPTPDQDPALRSLLGELLHHPRPGVRLHAHRTVRTMLDRETYLHHTATLLDDPQPDLVRMAVRTLCHANWAPAIPALTGLLEHPHPAVRKAAAEALIDLGPSAIPGLRRAAVHARPDKRPLYTEPLERLTEAAATEPAAPRPAPRCSGRVP